MDKKLVKVTRCKDCLYSKKINKDKLHKKNGYGCPFTDLLLIANDYCSQGIENDEIGVKIINALNDFNIGYQIDNDGEMYFFTKEDEEKGGAIIATIESEYKKSSEGGKE